MQGLGVWAVGIGGLGFRDWGFGGFRVRFRGVVGLGLRVRVLGFWGQGSGLGQRVLVGLVTGL